MKTLLQGNQRYVTGRCSEKKSGAAFRHELHQGQQPRAVVVTCSDSRVAPEILFDADLGRIFVVRTAGNVIDTVALGSIEYAVEHLRTPLIVILGHENCGAVHAAIGHDGEPEGNLGAVIGKILPAVRAAQADGKQGADLAFCAAVENVKNMVRYILNSSQRIADQVRNGAVSIAGAYYSITSGIVEEINLE
jgi:carbonic anhydrase